ncbi:DUF1573 domain-containing protein [Massilibacteroides vaginae]|uniref:DUF1573 domain-containing protein n=1 Tax=Massilibacteroides vaginae TaxID=1673718 RepID=UPI000A1CDE3D|nr:DUF1573 domain-containing protein [Massilibacteroides vaginae]
MQTKFRLLSILCLTILFGCKETDKERLTRLVTEWQGKEIIFPENPVFTVFLTDTVEYNIPSAGHKVLVYVDSLGCTSCKLQLDRWKQFISYTDSVTNRTVSFLFFIHAKDYKEIRYLLKRDGFNYPVCLDIDDSLNKLNQFPSEMTFQTFLLNEKNEVEVIGNPIHNLAVKELYLKQITGETEEKAIQTTAEATPMEINFGTFEKSETKEAVFTVKNTGTQPLVIIDVATTCGCASPTFEKHPANPGEELKVTVKMQPKDDGFFNETITVKCNTDKQIKLIIRGQVI